jgi:hypothetical protein
MVNRTGEGGRRVPWSMRPQSGKVGPDGDGARPEDEGDGVEPGSDRVDVGGGSNGESNRWRRT